MNMKTMIEHAKLATRMYKNKIDMGLIKEFSLEEINNCCNRIENNKFLDYENEKSIIIQEELIRDEKFIDYLIETYQKKIDMQRFERLIQDIKEHNEKITDYPIEHIIDVINNKDLNSKALYDYLKYFSDNNVLLKQTITKNLNHFYSQDDTKFEELSKEERALFEESYLAEYNLIPFHNIKKVYEFLAGNEKLRDVIDFLNYRKLYIPLNIDAYDKINNNAEEIGIYIEAIANKISDNEIMYQLLLKWLSNGCSLYELKVIEKRIENIEDKQLEKMFNSKSSYINFIYANKLKGFPLDSLNEEKEELIIYAISNNKKRFLKLIEENMNDFLAIPCNSILYREKFYTKYINLNELTLKHLIKLQTMNVNRYTRINELKEQTYTFEEISTLYNMEKQYIDLYNELLDLKVDDRLLRIRQFIKKLLLGKDMEELEIRKLAGKIKEKPLYVWLENDFNKIKDIKMSDVIQILINYETISKFIPEIEKQNELAYLLRNIDQIQNYDNLKSIKDNIEEIDEYWNELKRYMNFDKEFILKFNKNIREFLLNNGAELAYKYYISRNEEQKASFKLIIKAELMGEFKKLKYHTNDLNEEIDYKLNEKQVKEWTKNNTKISEEKYDVEEHDDFYHTMILGEYPQRTCLSYKDGMYNKCLLACFDSNKKILYAKINGRIVARAMVRLTKGSYKKANNEKTLSFIDVENNNSKAEENKEYLTLFLEKAYISGIPASEEKNVKKLFIRLLEAKAKQMNALLVLSTYYVYDIGEEYIKTRYYMYISRSKSSSQYLDSLDGQATITDEGQYKVNNFLIWKPKESEKSIFDENIFGK